MRKLTQKLVLSVVTMALVVIALGTSTFAWFTLQNAASVGQFSANVTAGEGIEVSLGTWEGNEATITGSQAPTWYTVIPSAAITARLSEMYGSSLALKDVTSANGKVMNVRDSLGALTPSGALDGRYIEFKLFFRSAAVKTIKLSQLQITGSSTAWTVDIPFFAANNAAFAEAKALVPGNTMQVAAWTAARVSFINVTDNAAATPAFTYQRGTVDAVESAYANGTQYNSTALPAVSYATSEQFGAASYYAVKTGTPVDGSTASIQDATQLDAVGNLGTAQNLVVLAQTGGTGYYNGTIIARVWIEGWDADLFDAIFSTTLSVSMKFTA
ncbi:hypothetical protein N7603_05380 [Acholeplasma vituli]|uniref:SipW-cognate class signal peptide n=1 Tax=Paracholeplasma vituli TaxID=69473 RepID=A0ABT2PVV1_9MOLU|nr:hypothetical protein [Paracholeplasma vituli]MCU0105084.1 hypothetical protein [Paracholeplasma vituli]